LAIASLCCPSLKGGRSGKSTTIGKFRGAFVSVSSEETQIDAMGGRCIAIGRVAILALTSFNESCAPARVLASQWEPDF
jgi:hypothetical protein